MVAPRPQLSIRRARVEEAAALTELAMRSRAHWGYDDAFMAACLDELTVQPAAIERGEVWVGEEAGAVAGLLELVPDREEAEVRLIFVAPERIGSGVGASLWRHMEIRAVELGVARIGLDADPNAVPFYERMGMRVVGESASGSIPGRMLPRMRKDIGRPLASASRHAKRASPEGRGDPSSPSLGGLKRKANGRRAGGRGG